MSKTDATQKEPTKVITGPVRLSYFSGWTASSVEEGGEKKFSSALLIRKDDEATIEKINAATDFLKGEAKKKYGGKMPAKFKLPLRDGDEEKPGDPNYANCFFLNASSKTKPGIVGLEKDANGKLKPITDESEVYSGAYARVSLNFFLFDTKGNKGIAVGLNNIQKVKDGEPLAGKSDVNEDFSEEFEMDDEDMFN